MTINDRGVVVDWQISKAAGMGVWILMGKMDEKQGKFTNEPERDPESI